jgi:hypothetical protein
MFRPMAMIAKMSMKTTTVELGSGRMRTNGARTVVYRIGYRKIRATSAVSRSVRRRFRARW